MTNTAQANAVQDAVKAVDAHAADSDSVTFHDMQQKVQAALNLGASLTDIRDARQTS